MPGVIEFQDYSCHTKKERGQSPLFFQRHGLLSTPPVNAGQGRRMCSVRLRQLYHDFAGRREPIFFAGKGFSTTG